MIRGLLVGGSVGAVIGLLHGWSVYTRRVGQAPATVTDRPPARRPHPAYYGLWTLLLWVVFGSYVLCLWVISVVIYLVYRVVRMLSSLMSTG